MRTRLVIFLKCALIVIPIAIVDGAVFAYWDQAQEQLGGLLGFELGLVIFLNALAAFFSIDCVGEIVRLRGFGWFYDLPASRGRGVRSLRGIALVPGAMTIQRSLVLVSRALVLAVVFFFLEVILFPFIPAKVDLQFEAILVVVGILTHVLLSKLRLGHPVTSSPRSP